jgi:integrase/recombinase XerD
MVTYKVLIDERRAKSDGTYPIIIRITFNRKVNTINSGAYIHRDFWDSKNSNVKSTHPNAQLLNKKVTEYYLKVQKLVLQLEGDGQFDFEGLKEQLKDNYKPAKVAEKVLFKDYAEQLIATLHSLNKVGNATIYQTAVNRFIAYADNPKLRFTDITFTLLDGFKNELVKSGLKANSVSNYFRTLRAIYNKAIKAKVVDRSHYPFLDITIKTERTAKRAITTGDLLKIYNEPLKEKSAKWHARNYFFLSFSLIGISFTDLGYLKPENIKKGRLIYKRRKTGKELNIKLLPFTQRLLSKYQASNSTYLLPVLPSNVEENTLRAKQVLMQWIKTTNKWLNKIADDCKIEDEITTYVSRHTWATTAKRLGYSNELIAEAMGVCYGDVDHLIPGQTDQAIS